MRYVLLILISTLGFCNQTLLAQVCPGTPGQITWECYNQLFDDEYGEMTSLPNYPQHPYVTKTLYNTKSPYNYDNYIGGRIRGFIYVPSADSVTFNITGNEKARFFLSTDSDPAHMVLMSYIDANTNTEEYTKYPSQTSQTVYLQSGIDYYFEIQYVENTGTDFAYLWWKNPLVDAVNWRAITNNFLKDIACITPPCPIVGTPCDDGDPNTTNDIEDGQCHCLGAMISNDSCIGQRGKIPNYKYDNIAGSELNDLYQNTNYPDMPAYSSNLSLLSTLTTSSTTNYGELVQAYLKVPVSGNYKFNVTGDDQTVLFISSDNDPNNKQAHQCLVSGWTYMVQHDKYIWQSTANIYLEANQFYYIEINHKQGTGSGHFSAFWQTPFTTANEWKRIPDIYLYEFNCGYACIAQGSPCDDGDIFTNNDMYNDQCDCVGTPCSGPDCDSPLANYVPFEKCNVTDQLDNNASNNWLSCNASDNPNPLRNRSHWIKYDFGEKHRLLTTQVWNYNVLNQTDRGFQNVAIDYSLDGSTWQEFNTYTWPLATGESNYSGFIGPDFLGMEARYILITSLDDTLTCRGIGKIAFKAIICPYQGTACNDGNPNTVDDRYNDNCDCVGTDFLTNRCEDNVLVLGDSVLASNNYSAVQSVQSISQVASASKVSLIGGNYVLLNPGFISDSASVFIALIDTCDNSNVAGRASQNRISQNEKVNALKDKPKSLRVSKLEGSDEVLISFYIQSTDLSSLAILNDQLTEIHTILQHKFTNPGYYTKNMRTKKLKSGIYTVCLQQGQKVEYERLVVE